jgi:hypothetical protein
MAYYTSIRPPLATEEVVSAFFDLLIDTNVTEAYTFAKRSQRHRNLFESLVKAVHEEEAGDRRAQRAAELIGLPFDEEESKWFEDCLLHGVAAKSPGAKDTVLMRRLATGNLHPANASVDRMKGSSVDGVNWEDIRHLISA